MSYGTVQPFMLWNLYLAAFPLVLASALFRKPARVTPGWCAGLRAWLPFLPNYPGWVTGGVLRGRELTH